jgi:hypothetical protein
MQMTRSLHVNGRAVLIGLALVLSGGSAYAQKPRPFTVSGSAVDARGKPIEGAEVSLNADFVYGRASTTTGADGRYVLTDLIKATYRVQAWIKANYAGRTICHRLAMPKPTDYNSFPVSSGAVRDFRWQMNGRIGNTDSFFGAGVRVWNADTLPLNSGAAIEFTLVPTSTLLDGSKGATVVRQAPLVTPASEIGLDDVPIATYRMKAVLVNRDGPRIPLKLKAIGADRHAPEIDVAWNTESRCAFGTDNGVTGPFVVEFLAP